MAPLPSYISLGINFWHVKRNDYMLYGKYFTSWGVFGLAKKLKWKSFSLIVKYQGLKCKIDYTCILPSNDFQFYPNRERERESSTPLPFVAVPLTADQAKLFLLLPLSSSLYHPCHQSSLSLSLSLSLSQANHLKSSNPPWASCFRLSIYLISTSSRLNHRLAYD